MIAPFGIAQCQIVLARSDLSTMLKTARILFKLSQHPSYQEAIAPELPAIARFNPGHHAVMMGYDFHLTADGPKLIEVNTNAGGGLLQCWAARQNRPEIDPSQLTHYENAKLLQPFRSEWQLFNPHHPLNHIAILDEKPDQQYLYPEMLYYQSVFQQHNLAANIVDPTHITRHAAGLTVDNHGPIIHLIYNRHCDFYLSTPAMAAIREAYLAGQICLTPNPYVYGLLADKRRMTIWWQADQTQKFGLSPQQAEHLSKTTCQTQLMATIDKQNLWSKRNRLVFKPIMAYGSRGVLLGESISRHRFEQLDPQTTLVQSLALPSRHDCPQGKMKGDFRLFMYQNKLLAVAARLYTGQVTNFRSPGSGYATILLA